MIYIHGKGGHGRVVAEAWGNEYRFTDDADGTRPPPDAHWICAIGKNASRKSIGAGNVPVLHRTAFVAGDICYLIGMGVYVGARAVVNFGATLGDGCIVNTGAIVEHDCWVGDFAHIAPGAILCGNVKIGEGVLVGAGAVVKQGLSIGAWAVIGCGAVVTHDIPAGETWAGVPARKLDSLTPAGAGVSVPPSPVGVL